MSTVGAASPFLAGLGRLRRFRRGDFAVAAVHRRMGAFLCDRPRDGRAALFAIGRGVRLGKAVIDSGVVIPDGLVVGEDPELDAKRFRRTANGVTLITQPMLDKLGH